MQKIDLLKTVPVAALLAAGVTISFAQPVLGSSGAGVATLAASAVAPAGPGSPAAPAAPAMSSA
ncbi:MAG: hypothetical protein ACREMA_10950, partial [Longimicrobiales bacterium]